MFNTVDIYMKDEFKKGIVTILYVSFWEIFMKRN